MTRSTRSQRPSATQPEAASRRLLVRSLVSAATLSALLLFASPAMADAGDVTRSEAAGWTLIDADLSGDDETYHELTAAKLYAASGAVSEGAQVQETLTGEVMKSIRGQKGFENFGLVAKDGDYYSLAAGLLAEAGSGSVTWDGASVSITAADSVEGPIDVAGAAHRSGSLTFTGEKTSIAGTNAATGHSTSGDDPDYPEAFGFLSMASGDDEGAAHERKTVFSAGKTEINASYAGTPEEANDRYGATGVELVADAEAGAAITFSGKSITVSAEAAKGQAVGIEISAAEEDADDSAAQASGSTNGAIIEATNQSGSLKVDASGSKAVGLLASTGTFAAEGAAEIHATAAGKESVGVLVTGGAQVSFKGKTTVTAKSGAGSGTALDLETAAGGDRRSSAEFLGSETTLDGDVSAGEGTSLRLGGKVTVNGGFVSYAELKSEPGASLSITGDYVKFAKAHDASSGWAGSTSLGNLSITGKGDASVASNDQTITLSGDLALKNTTFTNEDAGEIHAGGSVVLEDGATFRNFGGVEAGKAIVLKTGGAWLDTDDMFDVQSNTFTSMSDTLEFAGGKLSTIKSNGDFQINTIGITKDATSEDDGDDAPQNGILRYSAGDYAYTTVLVNLPANAAGEHLQVTGGNLKAQVFKAMEGDALVSAGAFRADRLASSGDFTMKVTGGDFTVGTFEGAGGAFTLTGGKMTAEKLAISGGSLVLKDGGNLVTSSGQLFTNALADDGLTEAAGSLTSSAGRVTVSDGGKITVNDAKYNLAYANSAASLFNPALAAGSTLIFSGDAVELKASLNDVAEGTVHENLTGTVDASGGASTATVDKNVGVKDLEVASGVKEVKVASGKTLTLVGSDKASDSLVNAEEPGAKLTVEGTLALGLDGKSEKGGSITGPVEASSGGKVLIHDGDFSIASLRAEDGGLDVQAGSAKIDTLTLAGAGSSVSNSASKALEVKKAVIETAEGASHKITGEVNLGRIVASGDKAASTMIRVGENKDLGDASNEKGVLTVAGSLAGLNYFLDPAYVDGQEVADASSLVFNEATVDGSVVVGQNAIAVLGADGSGVEKLSDALAKSKTAWGRDGTLAAVYVGKPITVTGGLHVDQAATLASAYDKAVTFADKSVLVADVTNAGDAPMITASSFSIDEGAKAVLAGDLKAGDYRITSGTAAGEFFTNVVAANALYGLKVGEDGLVTARLEDASKIYGGLMQGAALANAGMTGSGADYDYVNALLSDDAGGLSALPSTAARFDAAMNPAGALTVFTTAYDRASELRDAVREESVKGEGNRLWVHVAGGKTKLAGISTGAQDIHAKTTTYGLVAGAEADLAGVGAAGAAFQAGTGDTKNAAVSAKDDFDYYGFSLYGKTSAAGIDFLADASVSWVKSDLSVGGAADVKADTTTTVWSAGVQAQKTFATRLADVTPFIGLDLYHVRGDSFCTGHGACVEKSNATAVEIPVGVKLEKGFATASGVKVSPAFSFSVAPVAGDKSITSTSAFAGAKSDYDFTFADDVKVRSSLGVDLEKGGFSAGLHAGCAWGNEERNAYRVELRAKYAF